MSLKRLLTAAVCAVGLMSGAAEAKTFRFAYVGDYKSLDPFSLNETFAISLHLAVYEGLVRRNAKLELEPALAERWEIVDPLRWRFHLRKGVKFHGGEPFTADDVLFSAQRLRGDGSDFKTRLPADAEVTKVDDHTVDIVLKAPNPILPAEFESFFIMSRKWAEANGAVNPTPVNATTPSFASLNANGTGPFVVSSHQPGVKTVWKVNPNWWDKPKHNLTEAVFTPVASNPTRVAALLSGEIDWADPIPPQDVARINANPNTQVLEGPETRTIYLGMDIFRDELKYSSVKGKNPFRDVRVRKAFYQAIDIDAIKTKVMRNAATPTALMIDPTLFPPGRSLQRHPFDVNAAKKLLAEAGYPDGFAVGMDCPNDRYTNDEAICQAIVGMLARAGIKIELNAQPKAKFFAKILAAGGYDTSFYLLGWTPNTSDSLNVITNLLSCRDEKGKGGLSNVGGYCNKRVDELAAMIGAENDKPKRDAMILEAFTIVHQDVATIPLHQQALAWGVSKKVKIPQRADNNVILAWVTME